MNFLKLLIILSFLLSGNLWAKNLAVVIGNNSYQSVGRLDNPINDANLISDRFINLEYEVWLQKDLNELNFNNLVKKIAKNSANFDTTVIYYAGHAVQLGGSNYLLAIDQTPPTTEEDITLSAVLMDDLINAIRSTHKIVLMDACRNNPLIQQRLASKGRGVLSRGLAPPKSVSGGIFIAYATASGDVATDGSNKNSPFASALAKHLQNPESIDDMFSRVTSDVLAATNKQQRPFKYASLEGRFCLPGPCDNLIAMNTPSNIERKSVKQKPLNTIKTFSDEIIKIKPENLSFFSDWVTYSYADDGYWQFAPASYQYNTKTNIVQYEDRSVDKITGIASIFAVNGTSTQTSTIMDCSNKKFAYEKLTDYDQNGKVTFSYTYKQNEMEWAPIDRGSIAYNGYALFCGTNAISLNTIPGTVKSNLNLLTEERNGTYFWGNKGKLIYKSKKYYGVLYEYNQITNNDFLDEKISAEVIVASAECNDRNQAHQLRTFWVNDRRKIFDITSNDNLITLNPNSPGRILLDSDCDGKALNTSVSKTNSNPLSPNDFTMSKNTRPDSSKQNNNGTMRYCTDSFKALSFPQKIDNITTWDAAICLPDSSASKGVVAVYKYSISDNRMNSSSVKSLWDKQKNSWCTSPDTRSALDQLDIQFHYYDSRGKFIEKNIFTQKDCS